jgi:hypothetical protein
VRWSVLGGAQTSGRSRAVVIDDHLGASEAERRDQLADRDGFGPPLQPGGDLDLEWIEPLAGRN